MKLISLVYVSLASEQMNDDEVKNILHVARDFNSRHNITGMLLYRDHFFIQALEGEAAVVEPLYEKIKQDPRHSNVVLVYKEPIGEGSFNQWSMGFNKISDVEANTVPGFNDFLQTNRDMTYFTQQPSRATLLLQTFKNRTYF